MITAEKLCIKCSHVNLSRRVDPRDIIEFTKFHVKEALRESFIASIDYLNGGVDMDEYEKVIKDSYPLENIK